ncbi:WD40 repeat-like protein [Testicularia cyperi]|uniref:WD40 repeat-like protein n=1 Tax=Testicularia cyperi TaxID=1882483 RepID=A0A317XMG8_9BASI|nr:WD40 repeat-like protein [Testicularia cyperi]
MTLHTPGYSNGISNGSSNGRPAEYHDASTSSNGHSIRATRNEHHPDDGVFRPLFPGSSIDRTELVKLTLQSLRELGYESTARALEGESGITLEHPSITAFRSAVLNGDWKNAERLLIDGLSYAARRMYATRPASSATPSSSAAAAATEAPTAELLDSVLVRPDLVSLGTIRFMLQKQRYLELLEARQTNKALGVLRERLTPHSSDMAQLHLLSSLVVSATPEELRVRAGWDGAAGESRRLLLIEIEKAVSPSIMIPSRRLPRLLEQAQSYQKQQDPFFNQPAESHFSLLADHQSDRSVFPSQVFRVIKDHNDEVWCLAFSHDGTRLATAGADKTVMVWDVTDDYRFVAKFVPLSDDISSVAWSPDDKKLLVSSEVDVTLCELDTCVMHTLREHDYTVGTVTWLSDGSGWVTGGMDGKIIFWDADGNVVHRHVASPWRVLSVAVSSDGEHMVAVSQRQVATTPAQLAARGHSNSVASHSSSLGSHASSSDQYTDSSSPMSTSTGLGLDRGNRATPADLGGGSRTMSDEKNRIHFFNLRTREEVGSIYMREEVVSVAISKDSQYVLVNVRPNELQLWDIVRQSLVRRFNGHKISTHVVACGFGGIDENFVLSGSEDSKVYVWHRATGRLIETLTGHEHGTVNAIAWHPRDPLTIASCGDDHTVRIWRPGGRTRSTLPSIRREPLPPSDDSEASGAANPFPWSHSDSPGVQDTDMMGSIYEAMEDASSQTDA